MWAQRYLDLAVRGIRSNEVARKIARHLDRFTAWLTDGLGHDRISAVTVREAAAWRDHLACAGRELGCWFDLGLRHRHDQRSCA